MENNVRLIDANALAEELSSLSMIVTGLRAGKGVLRECMTEYRKSVLRIVDEAPTIDPVQVVRCKECKYKDTWYKDEVYNVYVCGLSGLHIVEDRDFCSYGERR